jgi:hypothetical protein
MLAGTALARTSVRHVYHSAHTGLLYPVHAKGHLRAGAVTAAARRAHATAATIAFSHGARRRPHTPFKTAQPFVAAPSAAGTGVSAAPNSLLANFNGTSSRDSEVTNFGARFEPPDQGLCAGNGFVLEMVNSAYTVYGPQGRVITGPFNVNGPFDEGLAEFTSDPRCIYDAPTHTWFASILFINAQGTASHEDLAVNTSGDPTKLWTVYRIDTTGMGGSTGPKHPGCPCFGDQPRIGLDSQNVYISTDEFSILGPEFNGPQLYAVAKKDLLTPGPPSTPAHFVHFDNLSIGGMVPVAVEPATVEPAAASAEYFMNALDPNFTFDNRIGVWAMTNRGVVASGGKPTLSSIVITSEPYGVPPSAEQKGSSSLLDSGDDRMQQVQYMNGALWGELDSAITIPNDSELRSAGAWFHVRPTLSGGKISSVQVLRQGYVAHKGAYVLYPAVQQSNSGNAAMVFTLSSSSRFPSAAYAVLPSGGSVFGPITVAAPGSTSYDPNATRWGDYSAAALDPSGKSVWMATEYIPPGASQTTGRVRNWGTRVINVNTG